MSLTRLLSTTMPCLAARLNLNPMESHSQLSRLPAQDQSNHVLNDPFSDAIANNTIIYDDDADCYVVDLGDESLNRTSKPNIPEIQNYISLAENAVPDYKPEMTCLCLMGRPFWTIRNPKTETRRTHEISRRAADAMKCILQQSADNTRRNTERTHDTTGTVTYRLSEAIDPVRADDIAAHSTIA